MKGKIFKIKNMDDELVLPITTTEAVYSEDGKTLNDEIKNINSSLDNMASDNKKIQLDITKYKLESETTYTESFKRCIDELSSTGGIIFVPIGDYEISQIVLPSNIEIKGVNHNSRIFQTSGLTDDMIILKDDKTVCTKLTNLYLDGNYNNSNVIYFNNNNTNIDGLVDHFHIIKNCKIEKSNKNGVHFKGVREFTLDNLLIRKCSDSGIYLNMSYDSKVNNVTISECGKGFYSYNSSTIRYVSCKSFYCNIGFYLDGGNNCTLTAIETQSNELHGICLLNNQNYSLVNIVSDSNGRTEENANNLHVYSCKNLYVQGVLRSEHEGKEKYMINVDNYFENIKIDVNCIIKPTKSIQLLNFNNIIDCTSSIKVNNNEIYQNNIINYDIATSFSKGYFNCFNKKGTDGTVGSYIFNGDKQKIIISENTNVNVSEVGLITDEINVENCDLFSFSMNCSPTKPGMYGKIQLHYYDDNGYVSTVGVDGSTNGSLSDITLLKKNVWKPGGIKKIKIAYSVITENNATGTFYLYEPKLMMLKSR